jgi:predicted amidohydrolase YtcJ
VTTTLLRNGCIHAPDHPAATAMLVTDDRISWLGDGDGDGADLANSAATGSHEIDHVVELDGALVTPAFVDAHVHSTSTGIASPCSPGEREAGSSSVTAGMRPPGPSIGHLPV